MKYVSSSSNRPNYGFQNLVLIATNAMMIGFCIRDFYAYDGRYFEIRLAAAIGVGIISIASLLMRSQRPLIKLIAWVLFIPTALFMGVFLWELIKVLRS